MGRRPKLRASFYDDSTYLLRLGHAIEKDTTIPADTARELQVLCNELAFKLTKAQELRTAPSDSGKRKEKDKTDKKAAS